MISCIFVKYSFKKSNATSGDMFSVMVEYELKSVNIIETHLISPSNSPSSFNILSDKTSPKYLLSVCCIRSFVSFIEIVFA